jgi:hypothetical protein
VGPHFVLVEDGFFQQFLIRFLHLAPGICGFVRFSGDIIPSLVGCHTGAEDEVGAIVERENIRGNRFLAGGRRENLYRTQDGAGH